MAYSRTCKLVSLAVLASSAILVIIIVLSFTRPRLCPNDGELFYRSKNTCYVRESQGPCTNNLIILEEGDRSQYGECNCPFTKFNRTMLYHAESQACYFVFSKAYCEDGKWLTVKKEGSKWSPVCEENTCLHHYPRNDFSEGENRTYQYDSSEWVPVKGGKCVQLGSHQEGCPEGSIVRFHKDYALPSCFTPPKSTTHKVSVSSIGVPASNCKIGSYPSIMGKCQPQFEFDFD